MNNLQYSKTTSKKTILKIRLLIVAVFLISGVAYGSWKVLSERGEQPPKTDATIIAPAPLIQFEPDLTANWKFYRNEEYGFEIKYPSHYELSAEERTNTAPAIVSISKDASLSINISSNPMNLPLRDWIEENLQIDISDWDPIKVGRGEGLKSNLLGNMDDGIDVDVFFLNKEKKDIYHLMFSTRKSGMEKELKIFDQILFNFRLISENEYYE